MGRSIDPQATRPFDEATFAHLVHGAKTADSTARAWLYLEAAHVVGQLQIKPGPKRQARFSGWPWCRWDT
jgi:hypothetical protein